MAEPTKTTERPLRFCDACKQVDDHPRHVQKESTLHLDCCAAAGCATCAATEGITNGARGPALLDVIQSGVLDGLEV